MVTFKKNLEKRLSIVENERTVKEEISKSEDNRNRNYILIDYSPSAHNIVSHK